MAVFDTSFLIDLLRKKPEALSLRSHLEGQEADYFISTPSIMELWEGVLESALPQREKEKINELLSSLAILDLDSQSAKRAAELSHHLCAIS